MAGGLKEVRERISSVNSTQQITKAMKMVSAAKLKKASDSIVMLRPYAVKLQEMLSNVISSLGAGEDIPNLELAEERPIEKVLLVLITSDRGLAGAFNANLIKKANQLLNGAYKEQADKGNVTILTIGKKGYDAFKKSDIPVNANYLNMFQHLDIEHSNEVTDYLFEAFRNKEYDVVDVIYAEFKNAATQFIHSERFLPIQINVPTPTGQSPNDQGYEADYIFEPNKSGLLSVLIPKILNTQFFRYLLENNASEHGARMMAMEQATENANELLKDLKLSYNRARQAAITTEISEIVGGVAALEGES